MRGWVSHQSQRSEVALARAVASLPDQSCHSSPSFEPRASRWPLSSVLACAYCASAAYTKSPVISLTRRAVMRFTRSRRERSAATASAQSSAATAASSESSAADSADRSGRSSVMVIASFSPWLECSECPPAPRARMPGPAGPAGPRACRARRRQTRGAQPRPLVRPSRQRTCGPSPCGTAPCQSMTCGCWPW